MSEMPASKNQNTEAQESIAVALDTIKYSTSLIIRILINCPEGCLDYPAMTILI